MLWVLVFFIQLAVISLVCFFRLGDKPKKSARKSAIWEDDDDIVTSPSFSFFRCNIYHDSFQVDDWDGVTSMDDDITYSNIDD